MFFGNPSMFTRLVIGKLVGLVLGIIGFFLLPFFWPEVSMHLRVGFLFWYATFGAMIAAFGVVTWHPVLKLPLPWWFRAPLIGAWMNLLLILIAWSEMQGLMNAVFGPDSMLSTPYWGVFEGAVVGLLIGYLCTKFGGEGEGTVDAMSHPR